MMTPIVINPGFEERNSQTNPPGWVIGSLDGSEQAAYIEPGGHSGAYRLTHSAARAYLVSTSQVLTGLVEGWYTLRAWIRSSGGQLAAYIGLKDYGDSERKAYLPVTSADQWVQVVVSAYVSDGRCTIELFSDAQVDNWAHFDDIEFEPGCAALSILGADISSLKKSEDKGGVYLDENGVSGDALQILKQHGVNYIRLRVWVNPADGYHNKARVLHKARRIKDHGLKLLVDFHYSDTWADPGKQFKPAAWKDYSFVQLVQAVYDHTYEVCHELQAQSTPADMVQVGNEINNGLLWPDGKTPQWDNLAALLKSGYAAVKACHRPTAVMLHLAEGGDNPGARHWFDHMMARDVQFDLIGLSHYTYWHGSLADLQYNLTDLTARYQKNVVIAETAYPFTLAEADTQKNVVHSASQLTYGYTATEAGQAALLRDVMTIVRAVPAGRGLGIFYWEPTWTAVPGNGWDPADPASGNEWENQALFNFDHRPTMALNEFKTP
jgi:arabinogalactan endo-1,4-beta-galactosidase